MSEDKETKSSDFATTCNTVTGYSESIVLVGSLDHEIEEEATEYKYLVIFMAVFLMTMELALM